MIHTLQGDCLDMMFDIEAASVGLILTDLPFGMTRAEWDKKIDLKKLWQHYRRVRKPNAPIVLFGAGAFTAELIMSNRAWYKYSMVWIKTTSTNFLNAKKQPLRQHEDIVVFYNKQCTYNPQKTTGHKRKVSTAEHKRNCIDTEIYGKHKKHGYDSTERYPTTVLHYPIDKYKKRLYSTQKPVALLEYLIKTYSNPGDTILDNCAGSGGVGEAAENTGRNAILIDKRAEAIEISTERLKKRA